MKIFFVGGIFAPSLRRFIVDNSTGVIQNAADVLQWGIIKGLSQQDGCDVSVVNLPFVGSFPSRFKKLLVPCANEHISSNLKILGLGFCNFSVVKHFSRACSLSRYFKRNRSAFDDSVVILYSAHTPFLYPAISLKKINPEVRLCLVIPDLPQYMSESSGVFYRVFKSIDTYLFNRVLKDIDFFVTLTADMQTSLGLPKSRCIVMEGVANEDGCAFEESECPPKKYILYSGTLAARYGVRDLVDAFGLVGDEDLELWICGDGDARSYIEKMALSNGRIKYLGQLKREEVVRLQRCAAFLVNPRTSEGEYTKYSFPSKIIEYMMSGRPVIMHRLPGVPAEYYEHCFAPEEESVESLAGCIKSVLNYDSCFLSEKGLKAKEFVMSSKTPKHQAEKIINLIKGVDR